MGARRLRLAIVGCGAVAERCHAPALRGFDGFVASVMVDRQPQRAEILKRGFPDCTTAADHSSLRGQVDAAIVALPGALNASVAAELLETGISVLVEKPMALSLDEAKRLEVAAAATGGRLAVGFIRREG